MAKKASKVTVAERADRAARDLEAAVLANLRLVVDDPVAVADTLLAHEDTATGGEITDGVLVDAGAVTPKDLDAAREMTATDGGDTLDAFVASSRVIRRWAQTRVVYVIDPTTLDAVVNTDWSDTVIPGTILRRLPHPNPLVLLPNPVVVPNGPGAGSRMMVDGFFVTGWQASMPRDAVGTGQDRSTTDPRINEFKVSFVGRMVDPVTGRQRVTTRTRLGEARSAPAVGWLPVMVTLDDASMTDRAAYTARIVNSVWEDQVFGNADVARGGPFVQFSMRMTETVVALLTYLATDNLDAATTTVAPQPRGKKQRNPEPPSAATTVVEAGFRVGAALRTDAKKTAAARTDGTGTGRSVAPHIRRAHAHLYWRGPRDDPGKRYQVLHWLPPIPVNWEPGPTATTQIHHA